MIEHTASDDSLAAGWSTEIRSESDTSSKNERLLPRFHPWTTGWIEKSFTDKKALKANQIWRKS